MSDGAPSRLHARLSRVLGNHFHTRRFLNALAFGVAAVLVLFFTGLSQPWDQHLLDVRLRVRPNLLQKELAVRVALLSPPEVTHDLRFLERSRDLLARLGSSTLPPSQRPKATVFVSPFLGGTEAPAGGVETVSPTGPPLVCSFRFGMDDAGSRDDAPLRSSALPRPVDMAGLREARSIQVPVSCPAPSIAPTMAGFANLAPEESLRSLVRSLPLVMRFREQVYPSLALAAAMVALEVRPDQVEVRPGEAVILRPDGRPERRIPIDARGDTYLNLRPTLGELAPRALPLWNRARPASTVVSTLPPAAMLPKLEPGGLPLFVGDPRLTARTSLASDTPLVNIQAQLTTDILSDDFLRRVHPAVDLFFGLLSVLLLALYVGRFDPQGLGGAWAGVVIGVSHGTIAVVVLALGTWWMDMALVAEAVVVTAVADGIYLHRYLKRAVSRLQAELDSWEREESEWLERIVREEREQADRLEQLQREEMLARAILDRQAALVARAMPTREVGPDGAVALSPAGGGREGAARGAPARLEAGGADAPPGEPLPAQSLETPFAARAVGQQPALIRTLSGRYRAQLARHGALLSRYRQLLDQVLTELEESRARQPVAIPTPEGLQADELVAKTGILTADRAMLRLLHQIVTRVGPNDRATVLIHGESGTGKELVARAIHVYSPRRQGPFVALNCGAFPEGLIESELFGHVRGAFSGAARDRRGAFLSAQGGVLFLDEIGDAPPFIQVKLLRALQERQIRPVGADADVPVDVRIVAATHQDLRAAVRAGRFREDLYHRLHVIPIELPPLRSRADDIPLLSRHFLEREARAAGHPPRALSEGALARLRAHLWPGNIRELENCIVALNAVSSGPVIEEDAIAQVLGLRIEVPAARPDGFSGADQRWLEVLRRHRFSIVHAVADPEAPAHNRQTGYRRLVGLSCKALYLADWTPGPAARLLAGEGDGPAFRKALAKIGTYLRTLEQALEGKDLGKFESDWRRFLGEDYFFVKATLEAVQAGRLQGSGEADGEED